MDLVTGAVGGLISKLSELLQEEYKVQRSVPEKIEFVIKELECAQAALLVVAGVQLGAQDKIWAREVREASYDMEDVLDTFLVSNESDHGHSDNGSMFSRIQETLFGMVRNQFKRRKMALTINDIIKRLEDVKERYGRYTAADVANNKPSSATLAVDPRLAATYREASQLVGIERSSNDLISKLSLQESKMKTVSVVGIGGLGKTTLAKSVYDKVANNKDVFNCRAFVSVGRDPDLKKIFRDILIELDRNKYVDPKMMILDGRQLIDELREYLRDKRYFIVIDDIWDIGSWEAIKLALVQNNNGSRLITTSRIFNVARQADEVYELKPLPQDPSKRLFDTRISGADRTCPDNQLNEVNTQIVKKCDGVPLAIITMASLFVGKTREGWIEVCNSVFRDKSNRQGKPQVSDTEWILSLSYYDLPLHLKICLLYLSAFPEDYTIGKNSLIWMWVAEGFVQKEERTGFFEVGERYFNELINRSMIQVVLSKSNSTIVHACKVHDMVLDLLRHISQEENFMTVPKKDGTMTISPSSRVRRLAHQNRTVELTHRDCHMDLLGHLRSLIACNCGYKGLSPIFKLLRVLALENCKCLEGFTHLEHLESLIHLRYIGLRKTNIIGLPKGIGVLKFLQTLDISDTSIKELPLSIAQLRKLICLCAGKVKVPNGVIEKLSSLEELQIHAEVDTAAHFVKELGRLLELRVLYAQLDVTEEMQLDLVKSLGSLHKIQNLELDGRIIADHALWKTGVLPRSLRRLIAPNLSFSALPSCINCSSLPNLSNLDIEVNNMDALGLKILGKLPELHHLKLKTDSTVTLTIHAANDGCFFQKLRSLSLPLSTVQFVLNEDSSVSFTVSNGQHNVSFGSRIEEEGIVAPSVMQNLEVLEFQVIVVSLMRNNGSCDNLGLECIPWLQKVKVEFRGGGAISDDVEREAAALRKAIEVLHPNHPRLEMGIN